MSTIKLILRPRDDRNMTINSPVKICNDNLIQQQSNREKKVTTNFTTYADNKQKNILYYGKEFHFDYSLSSNSSRIKVFFNKAIDTTNANEQSIRVIDLKIYIANEMKIKPDMLNLYIFNCSYKDKFNLLQDMEPLIIVGEMNNGKEKEIKGKTSFNSIFTSKFRISNESYNHIKTIVLYYKISYEKQKVMVDIFQNSIDRIIFDLSPFCSIYMLKYLLNQKIGEKIDNDIKYNTIKNKTKNRNIIYNWKYQTIYGAGFIYKTNKKSNHPTTNKKFDDIHTIEHIVNYYINKSTDESQSENGIYNIDNKTPEMILNLILIQSTNKKVIMGLDFRFNYMKNFIKVDFDEEAPSFREASDGLNLIIYCKNEICELKENYFVIQEGYGTFDILIKVKEIRCPKCGDNKIEMRSLGMINAKWVYKGLIQSKQESRVDGDGFTLENNKLYALPEIKFISQFKVLLIEVSFYQYYDKKNEKEESELNDLDEVDLYIKEQSDITEQKWTIGNKMEELDTPKRFLEDENIIQIEGRDKVCCTYCEMPSGNKCKIW